MQESDLKVGMRFRDTKHNYIYEINKIFQPKIYVIITSSLDYTAYHSNCDIKSFVELINDGKLELILETRKLLKLKLKPFDENYKHQSPYLIPPMKHVWDTIGEIIPKNIRITGDIVCTSGYKWNPNWIVHDEAFNNFYNNAATTSISSPKSKSECKHKWKVSRGLYSEWKDCELCGAKWEDVYGK